jgi:hypothetical protein
MDTQGLIDNRNLELWNTLRSIHEIEICKENRPDYLASSNSSKTTIYVPLNNLDSASFTHELLHIYLRTKQVFIGGGLVLSINDSQVLSKIFSDDLLDHIDNCLDHIKMLPEFLRFGYNKNKFISDYSINKLTKEEIAKIKKHFTTGTFFSKVYYAKVIDAFIGKFFAANACPNDSFDYAKQLVELQKIDTDLFQVLDTFLTNWKNFDYNNTDPITGNYHMLLFDFIENLEKWTRGKIIK